MSDRPPLPRRGSGLYPMVSGDQEQEKRTLGWFRRLNRFLVVPLYRLRILPLLGAGRVILVLATKGRRSGKTRWTPLEYRRRGDEIFVFSGRGERADWFRNMEADRGSVRVLLGFREHRPRVEVVEEEDEKVDLFRFYVSTWPWAAKTMLGWDPELDDPETADFEPLIELLEVIRLRLE